MMIDPPCTCGHTREEHGDNERGHNACHECPCVQYEPDSDFKECAE